jgi:hypothetical protein
MVAMYPISVLSLGSGFERVKSRSHGNSESLHCVGGPERSGGERILLCAGEFSMLMTREKQRSIKALRGWAFSVLQEAGAILKCEEHGWMQDRADPHARERAFDIARRDPPGISPEAAAVAVAEVLGGIGDTCPECALD